MKFCFTWLAMIGLAVWTVGCGSADSVTGTPDPAGETVLGESGTTTPGMDPVDEDTDTETEEGTTGGPELP